MIGEAFVLLQLRGDKGTATVRRCHASLEQRVAQTTIHCVQDFADTSPEPLRWLQAIVQAVQHDAAALAAMDDSLPIASLPLRDVALAVTQRRLDLLAASGNADPAFPHLHFQIMTDMLDQTGGKAGDVVVGGVRRQNAAVNAPALRGVVVRENEENIGMLLRRSVRASCGHGENSDGGRA